MISEITSAVERLAPDERPSPVAVSRAHVWLLTLRGLLTKADLPWVAPHVAVSPRGEMVFEWWEGTKTLTVYVDAAGAEFVKSWGKAVTTQMSDGKMNAASEMQSAWLWLQTP